MLKQILLTILASAVLAPAANALEISCLRDDDGDDWSISGTLGGATLNLWDNDSDSEFRLLRVLESHPPQYVYQEVKDETSLITIKPNLGETAAKAVLTGDNDYSLDFTCTVSEE